VQTAVSGLVQEFPGKVEVQNLDATTSEAKQDVQSLGFQNHGLVIRSAEGAVLWKQPDHTVQMDDVRKELRELTKSG
jgi:hypothetical protein